MKKIIRVFPKRTSYTPNDEHVYIGRPDMFIPEHDEIHISCTFTWDKQYCNELYDEWKDFTNKPVFLGGPAFGSEATNFVQGLYMKPNIIFTTRGCNNNCPWCCVHSLEGNLKELPVVQGNIIQDNNFLQSSKQHKQKVYDMLKTQKGICFRGGLEADLVDDDFVDAINSLYYTFKNGRKVSRISELWLACDTDNRIEQFKKACDKLRKVGFTRDKIHCYVLSYGKDMDADEARARTVYEAGAMPFMQLYRDFSDAKTEYSAEWNAFARMWQRPAATRAHVEKGTSFREFNT